MGLLYLLPISLEEDHASLSPQPEKGQQSKTLTLKSYGLPLIFWFYLVIILIVIGIMHLLIKNPLHTLSLTTDPINQLLAKVVWASLILTPLGLTSFFFYAKKIKKSGPLLTMEYHFWGIPFRIASYQLRSTDPLIIRHFMESPNLVRIRQDVSLQHYMNKGYFELWGHREDGKMVLIDRHSRKSDLVKIKELLEKF